MFTMCDKFVLSRTLPSGHRLSSIKCKTTSTQKIVNNNNNKEKSESNNGENLYRRERQWTWKAKKFHMKRNKIYDSPCCALLDCSHFQNKFKQGLVQTFKDLFHKITNWAIQFI